MKSVTTSVRLPAELRNRLEITAARDRRGKNWVIVQALEAYLARNDQQSFVEEARRQSRRASATTYPDERFWEDIHDTTDWRS